MANDNQSRFAENEDRIRDEAHKLWLAEGRPDGRAERHWTEAREIVAIRDSHDSTLRPLDQTEDDPVEDAETLENQGDLPSLDDQETRTGPSWDAAKEIADVEPLSVESESPPRKSADAEAE